MQAIEISRPGGPEVLTPVERPAPVPAAGELLIEVSASGVNRPDVLQRLGALPAAAGRLRPAGSGGGRARDRRQRRGAGAGRRRDRRPRLCADPWRRLRAAMRGAGRPGAAGAQGPERCRGGEPARDLLHGLDQRLRARSAATRRDAAGAGRCQRHRRHRDPDRQGAGLEGDRHRRRRREGPGLPRARCRPCDQLQDSGFRGRGRSA